MQSSRNRHAKDEGRGSARRGAVPKVLVSKLGLDGHDRGAKVIARSLAEAGFEVVYLGVHQSVQQVVKAVIEEDASVLAVSILSGAHLELAKDLLSELNKNGARCRVIFGGIVPPDDIPRLRKMGIFAVLGPGTSLQEAVSIVRSAADGCD